MKVSLCRMLMAVVVVLVLGGCTSVNTMMMRSVSDVEPRPDLAKQPLSAATSFFVASNAFGESEVRHYQETGVINREASGSLDEVSAIEAGGHVVAGVVEGFSNLNPIWALSALGNVTGSISVEAAQIELPVIVVEKSLSASFESWFEEKAKSIVYDRNGFKRRYTAKGDLRVWELIDQKGVACINCTRGAFSKRNSGDYVVYHSLPANREWLREYAMGNAGRASFWSGLRWNGKVCSPVAAVIDGTETAIADFAGMCTASN